MHAQKIAYIFEALEKSEVSVTDFSLLTGISRESLYRWKKTQVVRDILRLNIAYLTAARLKKATVLGRLPLLGAFLKKQRLIILRKLVAEMATK